MRKAPQKPDAADHVSLQAMVEDWVNELSEYVRHPDADLTESLLETAKMACLNHVLGSMEHYNQLDDVEKKRDGRQVSMGQVPHLGQQIIMLTNMNDLCVVQYNTGLDGAIKAWWPASAYLPAQDPEAMREHP